MNPHCEIMSEAFHALAQPITALRANVELGLGNQDAQAITRVLENCLPLIDRLMQDLAVSREIASLDEEPLLECCDGQALLQSSVEEMSPVAQAGGIALRLDMQPASVLCHAPMFQRAIFLLLDEIIAAPGRERTISISLHPGKEGFLLEIRPGTPPGLRQKLCQRLMQFAGGCVTNFAAGGVSVTFRESSSWHSPVITFADKRLQTSR
jgi:signal transduction histidine kinase